MTDDELLRQLECRDTICFDGRAANWHAIEEQIDRLGFGDLYIVSVTQGRHTAGNPRIQVKPLVAAA